MGKQNKLPSVVWSEDGYAVEYLVNACHESLTSRNIDPDGLEEGNAILRGFQELDERNAEGGRKSGSGG